MPPGPPGDVEELLYEAVHDLRVAWHREDFPGSRPGRLPHQAREVAINLGAQVLAVQRAGEPVAFAQIERVGAGAEISQVYVAPDHRGAAARH